MIRLLPLCLRRQLGLATAEPYTRYDQMAALLACNPVPPRVGKAAVLEQPEGLAGNEMDLPRSRLAPPVVSVVIINYNGARWLERCLASLRAQTVFEHIEVIVADNASLDGSEQLAARLMKGWHAGRTLQHGINLGYSAGNNRGAAQARGGYLLFLNNDTWLEPECLQRLLDALRATGASIAAPLVMDYDSGEVQSAGWAGFDLFGLPSLTRRWSKRRPLFMANGCALLIEAELFRTLGGFDPVFFMYSEEADLCWRAWATGHKVILAPEARAHHRGAAAVNPRGYQQVIENRTSDTKRFYANRNALLVLLKNSQHLLLLLVPMQLLVLAMEAMAVSVLIRR